MMIERTSIKDRLPNVIDDANIKVRNIHKDNLIGLCELSIGISELAKDIDFNNMWGFTFGQLSELERSHDGSNGAFLKKVK